jgi:RNA polymerase sigma-70 factor (ECF subfamily)
LGFLPGGWNFLAVVGITGMSNPRCTGAAEGDAPATMISDEVLMLAFQQGSREAFDELYVRYRGPLYGFFRRRLNSEPRAEDLSQETFLVLIRGADRYEPRALVRTYLYAIAFNLLMSERRRRAHDGPDIDSIAEPAARGCTERELWLREGLEKLDDKEREILMLREYEHLSYSEIAELMQLPLNTVRSRLFRSRIALKDHLSPSVKTQPAVDKNEGAAHRAVNPVEGEA